METKVVRLSVCSCGYPLLKDDVTIGTVYHVDENKKFPNCSVVCGGCKAKIPSTFIWVHYRITDTGKLRLGGYLPMEAFDL